MEDEFGNKRGRGRGRGRTRGRGRGRGRGGRGKKVVDEELESDTDEVSSNNRSLNEDGLNASLLMDHSDDTNNMELNKENEEEDVKMLNCKDIASEHMESSAIKQQSQQHAVLAQTIDMEADISQLEAPTFTTISRGPPEPMLRLKWDHKVSLIGEKVLNPMIHCCDQCDKPILLYGRMIPCKHVFCLKCARTEPVKICPRCNDKVVRVEQSGLGAVFMCTHGGSRYGNTGCRRTYLSQRDLQAHINHRHITQMISMPATITLPVQTLEAKQELDNLKASNLQRKISESSAANVIQTPSSMMAQRPAPMRSNSSIGSIAPPGAQNTAQTAQTTSSYSHSSLTQANIARINAASVQECHQSKVSIHQTLKKPVIGQGHHQPSDDVADASYYSSVLNSFCSTGTAQSSAGTNNVGASNTQYR